jgi:hypothetical protein
VLADLPSGARSCPSLRIPFITLSLVVYSTTIVSSTRFFRQCVSFETPPVAS